METLHIKKLNDLAVTPSKGSLKAAGYDLSTIESHLLVPGERHLFKTGLSLAIPNGMYGRIAPRSGLALKKGIDVMAGVIDEDYRGELGIILINLSQESQQFNVGDKVAQIIFEFYNNVDVQVVESLDDTQRGTGGFGSTTPTVPFEPPKMINITNRIAAEEVIKHEPPQKTYDTHTDILEKWKSAGGQTQLPPSYEKLIREREKKLS